MNQLYHDDDHDDDYDFGEEPEEVFEDCEPIGSCDSCECDVFDEYIGDDGEFLCGQCHWMMYRA